MSVILKARLSKLLPLKRCVSNTAPPQNGNRKRRKCAAVHVIDADAVVSGSKTVWNQLNSDLEQGDYQNSMGFFCYLPTEILHLMLHFLDHSSLGNLAQSSPEMCDAVQAYVYTYAGLKQVLPKAPSSFIDKVDSEDFRSLALSMEQPIVIFGNYSPSAKYVSWCQIKFRGGILLKQITILHSLHSRLKTASFFLNKLDPVHSTISEYVGTATAYECFGKLFSAYVAGWEEYEKAKAYCLVQSIAKLERRVNNVLRAGPASLPWHEKDVRLLHRLIFLCTSKTDQEYGFWLTQILKPWPIAFQARLLYLLTAPEDSNGFVSWTQVCGCSSLQHSNNSVDFSELARALNIIRSHRPRDWNEGDIISIIEELTTTPSGWCLENVAQLLMHCGTQITMAVLGCRAINGRVEELSVLFYYLAHGCVTSDQRNGQNASSEHVEWLIGILRYVLDLLPSEKERTQLISAVTETWRDYLTALFDDCDPEDSGQEQVREEFYSTLDGLSSLASVLLKMAVEHISS